MMDDLINRKAAIEALEFERDCLETPERINGVEDAIEVIKQLPSVAAVPLDKLCEFLADTLHTPAPCFNNEEICHCMDFGYCRLPDAPDVKECWKKILTKFMEGLDAKAEKST